MSTRSVPSFGTDLTPIYPRPIIWRTDDQQPVPSAFLDYLRSAKLNLPTAQIWPLDWPIELSENATP